MVYRGNFFLFLFQNRLWVLVRTTKAVLTCTHNQRIGQKYQNFKLKFSTFTGEKILYILHVLDFVLTLIITLITRLMSASSLSSRSFLFIFLEKEKGKYTPLNIISLIHSPLGRACHSIISPLCLVWVRAPLWPRRQAKFCFRVCQVVFLGVLPFSPTY